MTPEPINLTPWILGCCAASCVLTLIGQRFSAAILLGIAVYLKGRYDAR